MSANGSSGVGWRTFAAPSLACLVWLGGPNGPGPARAAEEIPVGLSFVGASDCNDRQALEREVERRSDVVSWVTPPGAPTTVAVRVADGVGRVDAVVIVERHGRPAVTRAITGSTCQEVIEGIALIIAVLLSPNPRERAKAAATEARKTQARRLASEQDGPTSKWRVGGGTTGVLVEGIAPGLLPGIEAFVDFRVEGDGWAPAFRLGFRHLRLSGFAANGGEVGFRLYSGVATACPVAWSWSPVWTLRPCALASYGVLEARGAPAAGVETGERHPWAGAGAGLRLEARLLPALSLEFEATSEAALVRSRFWFGAVTFHEASRLTGRVGLSVFARIP